MINTDIITVMGLSDFILYLYQMTAVKVVTNAGSLVSAPQDARNVKMRSWHCGTRCTAKQLITTGVHAVSLQISDVFTYF